MKLDVRTKELRLEKGQVIVLENPYVSISFSA